MSFIDVIGPQAADGKLARIYRQIAGPEGQVDNVLQIHSLRPHSLEGHMALYKAVLHHPRNKLPVWFLEAIGVLVSQLNDCSYCARHHSAGMQRLLAGEPEKYQACMAQLQKDSPETPFTEAEQAALAYAKKLTQRPGETTAKDIQSMRTAGLSDGEILEINQVASYFAYANRTVTGLGVHTEGEALGLSPGEDEGWQHG
jgi:uncharacterized peroxidase-related enzyme